MNREQLIDALNKGEWIVAVFWTGELQSLIKARRYRDKMVVTWEQAPDGAQFDESRYTRDERHEFATAEEVLDYLEKNSAPLAEFEIAE